MSPIHSRRKALSRIVPVALLAGLAACSSLQIDVDVYKGPLINEPKVQVMQFASLAIAARPLIQQMLTETTLQLEQCSNKETEVELQEACRKSAQFNKAFLEKIEDMYGHRNSSGIEELSKKVRDASFANEEVATSEDERILLQSLVYFAQHILYVVNNQLVYKDLRNKVENGPLRSQLAVLQSLGNTILVHANDIHRQKRRDIEFAKLGGYERQALVKTFHYAPPAAYDEIITLVTRLTVQDLTKVAALQGPLATAKARRDLLSKQSQDANASLQLARAALARVIATRKTIDGAPSDSTTITSSDDPEAQAIMQDSRAISDLFMKADKNQSATPTQLIQDWLTQELNAGHQISDARSARLKETKFYLESESAYFNGQPKQEQATLTEVLGDIRSGIARKQELAASQVTYEQAMAGRADIEHRKANAQVVQLQAQLDVESALQSSRLLSEAELKRALVVISAMRKDVVAQGEQAGASDFESIRNLAIYQLDKHKLGDAVNPITRADLELARKALTSIKFATSMPCAIPGESTMPGMSSPCSAKTPVDIIDSMVASLRAQRVHALTHGETTKASNLLNAINVAYEQRTAMIYLRPASDYLRTVYSATSLQEKPLSAHPNMLVEWVQYLNPVESEDKSRIQLEKLYWQNVNRVTLGGGGNTNYVLAKDDVGNWYVKSYSSDPDAIIRSATSLALYNAGKQINTNLLRRAELKRQIEANKGDPERQDRLRAELAKDRDVDHAPLLRMRDRYAEQYLEDTTTEAQALLTLLTSAPRTVEAIIAEKDNNDPGCAISDSNGGIGTLDDLHLKGARSRIESALKALQADKQRKPAEIEKAILSGMTAMHLYTGKLVGQLATSKGNACDIVRHSAAKDLEKGLNTSLVSFATERQRSITRFNDALDNIIEVSVAK